MSRRTRFILWILSFFGIFALSAPFEVQLPQIVGGTLIIMWLLFTLLVFYRSATIKMIGLSIAFLIGSLFIGGILKLIPGFGNDAIIVAFIFEWFLYILYRIAKHYNKKYGEKQEQDAYPYDFSDNNQESTKSFHNAQSEQTVKKRDKRKPFTAIPVKPQSMSEGQFWNDVYRRASRGDIDADELLRQKAEQVDKKKRGGNRSE